MIVENSSSSIRRDRPRRAPYWIRLPVPRRRAVLRRGVRLPCEVVATTGFRLLGRELLDVSEHGIRVATRGSYARIGEEVVIAFRPPGSRHFVDGLGRITRVERARRRGDRDPAIGIEWTSIDALDREFLSARVEGLPPPVPRRPRRADYARAVLRWSADLL